MAETTKLHIFIAHSSVDGVEYAEQLYNALTAKGISAWFDRKNLNHYKDFTGEIDRQIKRASHVAVCVTPDIDRDNSYVRLEIGYATGHRKNIIPAMFAEVVPPSSIVNHDRINFFKKSWTDAFSELIEWINQPDRIDGNEAETDLFRPYLDMLREEIDHYLDFAIIKEIPLHSVETPDVIETKQALTLLGTFTTTTVGVKPAGNKLSDHFDNFGDAYDRYGGRVLLLGDPGAGKTIALMTFARIAVARRLADRTQPLPILTRIAEWDAPEQTPLADWLSKTIPVISRDDFARVITDGNVLLMLDGLDELGSTAQIITKDSREDFLETRRVDPRGLFLNMLPKTGKLVVSCRVKDFHEIKQKVTLDGAITLLQLDDLQIKDYLSSQPDLWAVLKSDTVLHDVARTPLLLSIFYYGFAGLDEEAKKLRTVARGDIRDTIFETYVRRRYEHEVRKRELRYDLGMMFEILGRIAMEDVASWTWQANLVDTNRFADKLGNNYEEFIDQARLLHLLMPYGKGKLRFVHLLLRDYFAYRAAVQSLNNPRAINHLDAVVALRRLGDHRALEPLIKSLSDPDIEVSKVAVMALAELGDGRAVPSLASVLNDSVESVRLLALRALAEFRDERAVASIIKLLNDKSYDTESWYLGVSTLGVIGGEKAVSKLLALVPNRKIPRNILIKALGDAGDRRAIAPLREMAADPSLRDLIADAISTINAQPRKRQKNTRP